MGSEIWEGVAAALARLRGGFGEGLGVDGWCAGECIGVGDLRAQENQFDMARITGLA